MQPATMPCACIQVLEGSGVEEDLEKEARRRKKKRHMYQNTPCLAFSFRKERLGLVHYDGTHLPFVPCDIVPNNLL